MTDTPQLPPAYRLIALDTVDSTNDEAKRLAESGAEDGTVVWARAQSAGRGRMARTWQSPAGNLYFSLVLRPEVALSEALQLGFVAVVALGETLGQIVPPMTELRYKWPNDVLLDNQKVSGMLLESRTRGDGALDWLILGLGVNVDHHPREAMFPATSLRAVGCAEVTATDVLERFGRYFLAWVNRWLEEGFDPVRSAWLRYAYRFNEEIEIRHGDETIAGIFADIDDSGALVLDPPDGGLRTISFGEVFPPDV